MRIVCSLLAGMLTTGISLSAQTAVRAPVDPSGWREKQTSPRIRALHEQVAAGQTDTTAFWAAVSKEGTPLFDPVTPGAEHQSITFLWRGDADTRNVLVVWDPFAAVRPQDYLMHHVVGTDVWYLTVRLPLGARFLYQISLNPPLDGDFFGDLRLGSATAKDPLNALTLLGQSVVEMPGAPSQPWIVKRDDIPSGRVERYAFESKALGNTRDIWVYTPANERSGAQPAALLVLFDGGSHLSTIPTPTILDNLITAGRIPPTVAVLIGNVADKRNDELLLPNPALGVFLKTELLPWLRARHNVTRDPTRTIVGGESAGGTAAVRVALEHSDIFGRVLSQSGEFFSSPTWLRVMAERHPVKDDTGDKHVVQEMEDRALVDGNWLQRQVIAGPRQPVEFYMDAGVFEAAFWGGPGGVAGILESNRHMRDVLLAKGYKVTYQEFIGGHDYLSWRGLLADGLIALFAQK